jgi:hypothetical protein
MTRKGEDKNEQRQRPMRGSFALLRMTGFGGGVKRG